MSMIDEHPQAADPSPGEVPFEGPIDPAIIYEERLDDRQGTQTWWRNAGLEARQNLSVRPANDGAERHGVSATKESLKDPDVPATTSETARTNFTELTDNEKEGHHPSQWPKLIREKQKRNRQEDEEREKQELIRRALEARDRRTRAQEDPDSGISA